MPSRPIQFAPGEYYHLCNRSNDKTPIFRDLRDWIRFVLLITHCQSTESLNNMGIPVSRYVKHRMFNISKEKVDKILKERFVELTCFALMNNHFHILVKETHERGVSRYMQKIENAYTKYFNTKYKTSGHLFKGPFRAVHIENNEQLLHVSAYIHRNPREIRGWYNKEDSYPWSSYQDFLNKNRWGKLLKIDDIFDQFKNREEFKTFNETSGTKEYDADDLLD